MTARTQRRRRGWTTPALGAAALLTGPLCGLLTGSPLDAAAGGTSGPAPASVRIDVAERILDTRSGTGAPAGRVAPGAPLRFGDATADGHGTVVFNLTAVEATAPGYVSVWPCDEDSPATSVVNVVPGRAVPNTVVVARSPAGICLETSAEMHLVADLMAVVDADTISATPPQRVLDTRIDASRAAAGTTRSVTLPASGGPVAVLTVTAVEPATDGFVTAAPCDALGGGAPATSTVNFRAGETVAATTVVAAPGDEICLHASTATHLLVDHFARASGGGPVRVTDAPARLLDTRSGNGATGAAASGVAVPLRVAGRGGVPNGAAAAIVTATVIGDAGGHVTIWPCDAPRPETSVLNTWPGAVRANTAIVPLSRHDGELCLAPWTSDGSAVDLLVDVTGWIDGDEPRDPPTAGPSGAAGDATSTRRFPTLPPGSTLPSGENCAGRVRPTPEVRPANAIPNATRGTAPNGRYPRVDGDFAGTTDEIIQWASCKWGIDTDVVRAQIVKESWWNQSNVGDGGESFGLGQVREPYHHEAFVHDDAIRSSAYNLDYTYAGWRSCYEGNETWLNDLERGGWYEAGDLWGCVGVWFSGRWYVPSVYVYLDGGPTDGYGDLGVRQHLERRTWEHPDFMAGG